MKEFLKSLYKVLFKEDLIQTKTVTVEYCPAPPIIPKTNREKLYDEAIKWLGKDASPKDYADDEYGCQESVDTIFYSCFGHYINKNGSLPSLSTNLTYNYLLRSTDFIQVTEPMCGDLIISPTGYGNGNLTNGHIGILGKSNIIMSNSSSSGRWEENYTTTLWKNRYKDIGRFPIVYFRVI